MLEYFLYKRVYDVLRVELLKAAQVVQQLLELVMDLPLAF